MAPKKKKKRLSKREKAKLLTERGKKAAEARGTGVGSRRKFVLAANWREEEYETGDRERGVRKCVSFVSPGKTKYWNQKEVEKQMVSRNLTDCFYEKPASSEEGNTGGDDSEYLPSSEKEKDEKHKFVAYQSVGLEVERRLFVCESTQIMDMVEQINVTSKCSTLECHGE